MRYKLPLLLSLSVIIGAFACSKKGGEMRERMREAYGETAGLFNYVWAPELFKDPAQENRILASLDRLIEDFHGMESINSALTQEPGFRVTLATHEEALRDIRRRFAAGQKDYANWRLRALTANCISCHSRFEVSNDFLGQVPIPQSTSFEARLAQGEFLLATRQFDKAAEQLFTLAKNVSRGPSGQAEAFEALKLWLVVEVRVKDRPGEAAEELASLLEARPELREAVPALSNWVVDLKSLKEEEEGSGSLLADAQALLEPVLGETTIPENEARLVKTLKATANLHSYLQTATDEAKRRRAFFLLAVAYQKIPVTSLELFQEMYLEQVILEFPETEEAQKAYALLEELIEFEHTGSGGLHLENEEVRRLQELRVTAFGSESEEQR